MNQLVIKKILVPVDFSPSSHNASEYAAQLAKETGAEVHLLHVYAEPMPVGSVPDIGLIVAGLQTEYKTRINHEVRLLKEKYGVVIKGDAIPGFKSDTIDAIAEEAKADLVLMGVKTGRKSRALGSTTLRMIRKSEKPLLLVPEDASFRPLKEIVFAIDFTEIISNAGMEVLYTLAKHFDACITVLHVRKIDEESKASFLFEELRLGRVLAKVDFSYEPAGGGNVNEGILNFLNDHPADMLTMIAHHHSVLERLFNPVHTGSISTEINIPLLVLKSQTLFG